MSKQIQKTLYKALLLNGAMEQALYEFDLKEHLDYWKEGLIKDNEDFVFAITVNKGDVAMVLITTEEHFVNEKARQQLKVFWKASYEKNFERMLPSMAMSLSDGKLSVTGVKVIEE